MNRVAVTGVGWVSPAGTGAAEAMAAWRREKSLGQPEMVSTLRGHRREMSVAKIHSFDKATYLSPRKLRRMGKVSQIWVISCLLAFEDTGLRSDPSSLPAPERRGTYLGTGFGCIDTTWDFLAGMFHDGAGMANPFLFSESVANAPAGHSAIELGTKAASVTFTCGDASATTAVSFAARAIREGRVDMAYCGGVELLSSPLLRVLATIGAPRFVGEGGVCLVLEPMNRALDRDARIYAEVLGEGMASDPQAPATDWSQDAAVISMALRRATSMNLDAERVFLHACGASLADAAERQAVSTLFPGAVLAETTGVFGGFAAAGGTNLAAAIASMKDDSGNRPSERAVVVNASSWGGSTVAVALGPL